MAMARLWLWRFAMLACAVTVVFFAAMAVAPFDAVQEPVLGAALTRARYWAENGFAHVQLLGVFLWGVAALTAGNWARGVKAFAAALLLFGCFMAMASEYGSLIAQDMLRDPIEVARHKLMVSRGITLALALASLAIGAWARPNKLR
jgi:hypothetical protein